MKGHVRAKKDGRGDTTGVHGRAGKSWLNHGLSFYQESEVESETQYNPVTQQRENVSMHLIQFYRYQDVPRDPAYLLTYLLVVAVHADLSSHSLRSVFFR